MSAKPRVELLRLPLAPLSNDPAFVCLEALCVETR